MSLLAFIEMRTGRLSAWSCPAGIWRGAGPGASCRGTQPGQPGGQLGFPVRDRPACPHYLPDDLGERAWRRTAAAGRTPAAGRRPAGCGQRHLSGVAGRAPRRKGEADELIDSAKGIAAELNGLRGSAPLDREALRELILRFTLLLA